MSANTPKPVSKGLEGAERLSKQIGGKVALGDTILEVRDLGVRFWVNDSWFTAAQGLTYDLKAGEVLAIVGESGSGKTQSAMSLIGLLPKNGRATGSAKLKGTELIGMSLRQLQHVRGNDISVIFQEPMTALNPVYTVGFQIVETLRTHFLMQPAQAKARAIDLMRLVEIPNPEDSFEKFPHQLSGGQRQRIMIAQALACDPGLLIADEPTTALDVTVQGEILKLMRDLRERVTAAIILITHDMGVVADMADRIVVMKDGQVVEHGTSDEIFNRPQHPYTKQLLASVPHLGSATAEDELPHARLTLVAAGEQTGVPLLESTSVATPAMLMEDVAIEYPKQGRRPAFRAAHHINLRVDPGEVIGLVGESGSGKTTIGRAAVALLPVVEGRLSINGRDITNAKPGELKPFRKEVGIVFQDPGSSLNPRLPVGESIGEPIMLHLGLKGAELSKRVENLLESVQLPRAMRNRYPHELSGGQRQRIGIARALAAEPRFIICDEVTSALDQLVAEGILKLLDRLQGEFDLAYMFITHDLATVKAIADEVVVMQNGKVVEEGPAEEIFQRPREAYTQALLAAALNLEPANSAAVRD